MRRFLFICILVLCSSQLYSQNISLSRTNISLDKIFAAIQEQTGLSFIYDSKLIQPAKTIDINVWNLPVEQVLNFCLKDLPLTFSITDKIIIIRERIYQKEPEPVLYSFEGLVQDESGTPLDGATILLRETGQGIQCNSAGRFLLDKIKSGTYHVEISVVGFSKETRMISFPGPVQKITASLKPATNKLEEVTVFTALGIARKSNSISYSTQQLNNKEFTTVKSTNLLNSFNGKLSGVQVNRTSGGQGGSVRLVIRGDKSTRSSQPLFVIDGLPINNPTGGPDAGLYNTAPDAGDIISTFNPDDIESINILKGAAASALYGSQGSNGVILITTRKGKTGTSKVQVSSSVSFDRAFVFPQMQFSYGQTFPANDSTAGSEDNWGSKNASLPSRNYMKDFFQTGVTNINSITLSSGNDRSSNYLSYSQTNNKGVLPTNTFKQHTLSMRQTSKLFNDKLALDGTFLGSIQNVHNRPVPGVYFNPLSGLYLLPRGLDFRQYKNFQYFSPTRYLYAQNWWNIHHDKDLQYGGWGGQDYQQNPYWVLNRNLEDISNQNVYVSAALKYELQKKIFLHTRGNISNFQSETIRKDYATTQSTLSRPNGYLRGNKTNATSLYGDLMITGDLQLRENLGLNFTMGTSILDQRSETRAVVGTPSVPNVFLESALDPQYLVMGNSAPGKQVQSLFGSLQLNYRNKLFAEFSDRNDWSSTLAFTPTEKMGYNYYSIGVSSILSEMLRMPAFVDLARLRASFAIVGNDIAPFSTYPLYTFSGGLGTPPASAPINISGYKLQPERTRSVELGMLWNLFHNRIAFDITWYKSNTFNQYFQGVVVPPGLGTGGYADINGGNIQNTGVELTITGRVIQQKSLKLTTSLNFSHNRNLIVELFNNEIFANPSSNQFIRLTGGAGVLKQGGTYGDIFGRAFLRDDLGRIIVTESGIPFFRDEVVLGSPNPTFIAGLQNTLDWKNFSISVLFDGKFGGKVQSLTESYLDQAGISKRTGDTRDAGGVVYIKNAITQYGQKWSGATDAKDYYKKISGKTPVTEAYLYDATAIRCREISVTYKFPLCSTFIKEFRLGLIAGNLFFITRKAPFDPEQVAGVNAGGVGLDAFGLPVYRTLGFSMNVTF